MCNFLSVAKLYAGCIFNAVFSPFCSLCLPYFPISATTVWPCNPSSKPGKYFSVLLYILSNSHKQSMCAHKGDFWLEDSKPEYYFYTLLYGLLLPFSILWKFIQVKWQTNSFKEWIIIHDKNPVHENTFCRSPWKAFPVFNPLLWQCSKNTLIRHVPL